jgi:hypothetical protein
LIALRVDSPLFRPALLIFNPALFFAPALIVQLSLLPILILFESTCPIVALTALLIIQTTLLFVLAALTLEFALLFGVSALFVLLPLL